MTRLGPPHPEKATNRPRTSVVYGRAGFGVVGEIVVDKPQTPFGPRNRAQPGTRDI
ncbi:hypothetical protein DPMN_136849 [Dreissena polymorpha]|uniref:Uncharacterized protein n=1 Tax=Dreissena polymorpha TaxID=45954 RepID=A0A9D4G0T3_DREPO|nr:hypothetical protein DPMN_136849 [Dreissena polymorpha]